MEQEDFDFKAEYKKLEKEHNLPKFSALAQDFDIEKIQEKESTFLIREVRRVINEKITAYVHLFETLINPNSPPMFVFKILKNISEKEKKQIQGFYKVLSKTQIEVMRLDTLYSEKEEAKFINKTFKDWQKMKLEIHELFTSFEKNFEKTDISEERSYFD